MAIEGWRYYNHALVPTTHPHEEPDVTPIINGLAWTNRGGGTPLLARWTTEWDCGYETNWWYCIKDTPFDISLQKSKRRYEINKGNKWFDVKEINPEQYAEEILNVTIKAFEAYPLKYRPRIDNERFLAGLSKWKELTVFGAFHKEDDKLQGYSYLRDFESHSELIVLRTNPEMERFAINAALVNGILRHYADKLQKGFYISDGERTILHETAFQDYLEKYFGFRKAFCKLHVQYRPRIKFFIKLLYPLRKMIPVQTRIGSQLSAVLRLEELSRQK